MIERLRLAGKLPEPISHYTDAVRAGDTLWISGILPLDANGSLVGGDDAGAQAEQVLANLALVLHTTNASFADVVTATRFVTDLTDQDALNRVWAEFFKDAKPATTTVQVVRLATDPRCLVEINAVAVID